MDRDVHAANVRGRDGYPRAVGTAAGRRGKGMAAPGSRVRRRRRGGRRPNPPPLLSGSTGSVHHVQHVSVCVGGERQAVDVDGRRKPNVARREMRRRQFRAVGAIERTAMGAARAQRGTVVEAVWGGRWGCSFCVVAASSRPGGSGVYLLL